MSRKLDMMLENFRAKLPEPVGVETEPEAVPMCPACLDAGWVYLPLPLDHPDRGKAFACECTKAKQSLRYWQESGVPKTYREYTLDSFPASMENIATVAVVRAWLVTPTLPSLYMHGRYGVGKTGLAAAICRERCSSTPALFLTVPDLLAGIRKTFGEKDQSEAAVIDLVRNQPFLVLDDLGAERITESGFVEETLFRIVNHRHNNELPTVFTSNLGPREMSAHLGERIVNRIAAMALDLELDGPNLRKRPQIGPGGRAA